MTATLAPSRVRLNGALAEVDFERFDLDAYQLFLRCKALPESQVAYSWRDDVYTISTPARYARLLDSAVTLEPPAWLPFAPHLFDYQAWIVDMALEAQRFAIWANTGLGKTAMLLEWSRQVMHRTGGRVLILEPLQVIPQVIEEAARFYGAALPLDQIESREALDRWCEGPGSVLGITNWEKLNAGPVKTMRLLGGLVADEASRLRTGGGVQKWNLIKGAKGIAYKLSSTATPAPNEAMEYASQAGFLERLRSEGEVLWTYFSKTKDGAWVVKPHARRAFYTFLASWSIYLLDPARFGFADLLKDLPPPDIQEHPIDATPQQASLRWEIIAGKNASLMPDERLGIVPRTKLSQLAKGFLYERVGGKQTTRRIPSLKPARVAELVCQEAASGRQVLVWTVFDAESEIVAEHLANSPGAERFELGMLHGSTPDGERLAILERFRRGDLAVLISKAALIGYGMNLQHCKAMVFSGWDDSFERVYQAIRRAYRYGQTDSVRVHFPYVPELEGLMLTNVKRKEQRFLEDAAECEMAYRDAFRDAARIAREGTSA